jgi:hypothetical protein
MTKSVETKLPVWLKGRLSGKTVEVDPVDYETLNADRWCYSPAQNRIYRTRADESGFKVVEPIHRVIMGMTCGDKRRVKIRNGNIFDCTRSNLWIEGVRGQTPPPLETPTANGPLNEWPKTFSALLSDLEDRTPDLYDTLHAATCNGADYSEKVFVLWFEDGTEECKRALLLSHRNQIQAYLKQRYGVAPEIVVNKTPAKEQPLEESGLKRATEKKQKRTGRPTEKRIGEIEDLILKMIANKVANKTTEIKKHLRVGTWAFSLALKNLRDTGFVENVGQGQGRHNELTAKGRMRSRRKTVPITTPRAVAKPVEVEVEDHAETVEQVAEVVEPIASMPEPAEQISSKVIEQLEREQLERQNVNIPSVNVPAGQKVTITITISVG